MKNLIAIIIILCLMIPAGMAVAEVTVDELLKSDHLSKDTREAVAKAVRKAEETIVPASAVELKKWQEFGDAFAITIKSIAHTLNVEVNEFLKSDVGKLTAGVIVYKMIGKDILRIIILTASAFMFTMMVTFSLLVFHKKKKTKIKETGEIKYVERFDWYDETTCNISFILHIVVWAIIMIVLTVNAIP